MKTIFSLHFLTVIMVLAAATNTFTFKEMEDWNSFKVTYDKGYKTKDEEDKRMRIFLKNKNNIEEHNRRYDRGLVSYKKGINKFSDMSVTELYKKNNRIYNPRSSNKFLNSNFYKHSNRVGLPKALDWRKMGAVTRVKNQEKCLLCWIFSAVGAVESHNFLKTGKLVTLSEQNVADCIGTHQDDQSCPMGWMDTAFEFILNNDGVDTEDSYPYEGKIGTCRFNQSNIGATIEAYADLPTGDETALRKIVAKAGPVSVAIDIKDGDFLHYKSGVFYTEGCKNQEEDLDHALLVVGYGKENGLAYWLVKNSWGPDWGEEGFAKIARNKDNHCGIATKASYPIV